jgi:hypothetical protein
MTVKELFSKFFKFIAIIFGIAALVAGIWQIWFTLSTGIWQWLTLAGFYDVYPTVNDALAITIVTIFAIISKFPIFVVCAAVAMFFNFLANKLD